MPHLTRLLAVRLDQYTTTESAFEARLMRTLVANGLPRPFAQLPVRLPSGGVARVDFAYPEALLAIEADSYRHHSSPADWSRDRVRNNELVALGWRVLPVTYRDLTADPKKVADQIRRCLSV
jgi:very-short-patch-repair endonuclease